MTPTGSILVIVFEDSNRVGCFRVDGLQGIRPIGLLINVMIIIDREPDVRFTRLRKVIQSFGWLLRGEGPLTLGQAMFITFLSSHSRVDVDQQRGQFTLPLFISPRPQLVDGKRCEEAILLLLASL